VHQSGARPSGDHPHAAVAAPHGRHVPVRSELPAQRLLPRLYIRITNSFSNATRP
jgi:hypothetical protein